MALGCPVWITLCLKRTHGPQAFLSHKENFYNKTVVYVGCVKEMKHTFHF